MPRADRQKPEQAPARSRQDAQSPMDARQAPGARTFNFSGLDQKALEVHRRLLEAYGERAHEARREPMHELISTILSQRTNWRNEDLAYRRMMERFVSWEGVEQADVTALAEAISPSNFAEVKAPNIQRTLRAIREARGEYNIDFLADLPVEEGLRWLLALPGVGLKTATLVLLFCFRKSVLPVDTHVHRVSQRVGLIGPKVMHEAAHRLLLALLPPEPALLYNFHLNLLTHGQKICTFSRPRCSKCVLREVCDYYHDPTTEKY
ncbi:endonuclease III domain-containing protein [Deinococcus peraridilitoris]|uniref:Putative endoIII-related endonuclease n=1 Tax=Deinococcus peraridilitoris (strain DSM 19664 / LMG 22246 / CIP 109416 / KR-200) TaxID=937777 RepID=L0A233_DEIPD|nr:endoIII-related endonuclease [Deinococcus peraridilitoris]AFZ67958.1 putative endoIII-related endonuclease [Deinococcus peraridilitoris DSM 19664]